jgi:hypothetical protein
MEYNIIHIEIQEVPGNFGVLEFVLSNTELGYSKLIKKTFVVGVPPNQDYVQFFIDEEGTQQNLFNNLVAHEQDGNLIFNLVDGVIQISFVNQNLYYLAVNATAAASFLVFSESFFIEPVEPVVPFDMNYLQIEVIDTYENDRTLQVEVARKNACVLSYESGEDIYEPLMASNLKFDMRVADYRDAGFLHLFTGNETRYKVKLNEVNLDDEKQLLWQGYLLPDMMRESYTNNNLFVNFEAIDMIASLKSKRLKPWEYFRKINIMRLLGEIMKQTGLEQTFMVKPSVEPANDLYKWWQINLSLDHYYDDKKPTELYEILKDVLQANLLTMHSYKGVWIIEGVTRKIETEGPAYLFDVDGVYQGALQTDRTAKEVEWQKDSLDFIAITPWKSVAVDFEYKGEKNLFDPDTVTREANFGTWLLERWVTLTQHTSIIDSFNRVGNSFIEKVNDVQQFSFDKITSLSAASYNVNAASSLANYFETKQKPFVSAGVDYKFELEVEVELRFLINLVADQVTTFLKNGSYDNFVLFSLLLNGVEIKSSRPSFVSDEPLVFLKEYKSRINTSFRHVVVFRLETYFDFPVDGYVSVRFFAPQYNNLTSANLSGFKVSPKILKLSIDGDASKREGVFAVRPIDYTNVLDLTLKYTFSPDKSVANSFGLGTQSLPYELNVPVGSQDYISNSHSFPTGGINQLFSWRFQITEVVQRLLFIDLLKFSCFVTRLDGKQDFFNSLYTKKETSGGAVVRFLYYLNSRVGRPKYPKEYKFIPKLEVGETVTILTSNYPEEDFTQRTRFKVYGETEVMPFVECLAAAAHNVRPEQLYGIEGVALDLVYPGEVIRKYYDNEMREFVTTRLTLDLFTGKTSISGREVKYQSLTDISYE